MQPRPRVEIKHPRTIRTNPHSVTGVCITRVHEPIGILGIFTYLLTFIFDTLTQTPTAPSSPLTHTHTGRLLSTSDLANEADFDENFMHLPTSML
jgi:hypothetical protein